MKIVTAATERADSIKAFPKTPSLWISAPPRCDKCKQEADAVAEFHVFNNYGDEDYMRLCAACLQAALDGVKAAAAPPLTSPPSPC